MGLQCMKPPVLQEEEFSADLQSPEASKTSEMIQKSSQEDVIEQLSPLSLGARLETEYADPIMQNILEKEESYSMEVSPTWIRFRRVIVDWITEYGEGHKVRPTTIHMCISMLDRMMVKAKVARDNLQKVSIVCMFISMKLGETHDAFPNLLDTINSDPKTFYCTSREMFHHEMMVLDALDMKVITYPASYFIHYWVVQGVVFKEDRIRDRECTIKVANFAKRYADFFYELCLQNFSFRRYKESLFAATCIYCARKALKITPLWRESLSVITTYAETDMEACAAEMWEYYLENFPPENGEKGEHNSS